jgi:hypothetical protein
MALTRIVVLCALARSRMLEAAASRADRLMKEL